jgi:hypothetical protein
VKLVAELLNAMVADRVIAGYAVFGAVAQMRYTEAVVTLDADILVALPDQQRLDALTPVYEYCAKRGYHPEGEAVRVGAWPVQFIPAFSALTRAALQNAVPGEVDGVPLRVVRADYLGAIAISVGRAKDFARVLALLDAQATNPKDIADLCAGHGLEPQWQRFKARFLDA